MPAGSLVMEEIRFQTTGLQHPGYVIPQAVTQSSVPEDWRVQRPKHVELIGSTLLCCDL